MFAGLYFDIAKYRKLEGTVKSNMWYCFIYLFYGQGLSNLRTRFKYSGENKTSVRVRSIAVPISLGQ